jgi:rubrerythrin
MTLTITKETNGKTFSALMTVVAPEQEFDIAELKHIGSDAKVNGHNLSDFLSAMSAHERCGVHLYRCAAEITEIDAWRKKYEEFGEQTEHHVQICEETIRKLGGDPMYVSLSARMTEAQNTKMMEFCLFGGSADTQTREIATLEAVLLTEWKCHANWQLLGEITKQLPEGKTKNTLSEAVKQVETQEDQHVEWIQNTWKKALTAQVTGK